MAIAGALEENRAHDNLTVRAFKHLVPELHNPDSGRLDAKQIAQFFGLPLTTIAQAIDKSGSALHKTPDSAAIQSELAVFQRIATALLHMLGSAQNSRIWLNAPNPELSGQTPVELITVGKGVIVAELLEDVLLGMPG